MIIYGASDKGPLKVTSQYLDPDDVTTIRAHFGAPVWTANTVLHVGDITRPTADNGYYYRVILAGKTGATEPSTWLQTSQIDGTVKFKAVPWDLWLLPSETLQEVSWTATTGVTLATPLFSDGIASTVITIVPATLSKIVVGVQATKSNSDKLSGSFEFLVAQR
jgi:hypothetical protein